MLLLDELQGKSIAVGTVQFPALKIRVRDLIQARVELEIERNNQIVSLANGPSTVQSEQNKFVQDAPLDGGRGFLFQACGNQGDDNRLQRMISLAETEFAKGRYFILVGDRQLDSLDQEIDVTSTGEALFLLLTPLQGG